MSGRSDVVSRAARFRAPGEITLEELEMEPAENGKVRVRLEGCGVCGSNLPVWEGRPWSFCFQGHPEASPGPHDIGGLFNRFVQLMQARNSKETSS